MITQDRTFKRDIGKLTGSKDLANLSIEIMCLSLKFNGEYTHIQRDHKETI